MDGVLYMLYGTKHDVQIVVSMASLRKRWDGPICIAAGDEPARRIAELCAHDERLAPLTVVNWKAPSGPSGQGYANKVHMRDLSPFTRTVFLDADTVVKGDIAPLFPAEETETVILTQFADWRSTGRIKKRIQNWRDVANREVTRMLSAPYPALNTGVIGFSKLSERFFQAWSQMAYRNISFICDELAAQLVYPDFSHNVLGDKFNWSPTHSTSRYEDAVVVHAHGPQRNHCPGRMKARAIWWPYYESAFEQNIAQLKEWSPVLETSRPLEVAVQAI